MDSWGFDDWLRQENPFKRTDNRLNITYINFITPVGLVSLAATCFALASKKRRPTVVIGSNYDLFTYLDRAGFIRVVEPIVDFEPPFLTSSFEPRFGSVETLIEVTKLETGTLSELTDLMDRILSGRFEKVLTMKLGYSKNDSKDVAIAISEVCQNIFEHNKNKSTCGFIAMQEYEYASSRKKFLEVGIADYGEGLAKTLKRSHHKHKITSHCDAILLATKYGVSEYAEPTRGAGMYYLFEVAVKHKGTLQIRSGDTSIRYRMDRGQNPQRFRGPDVPGVQISFMLGSKKP